MSEPIALIIIATIFLAGGLLKGIAGLGLPIITITGLTFFFGITNAVAITILPGFVANFIQAVDNKNKFDNAKRIAPFMIPTIATTWLGTIMLVNNQDIATLTLATMLLVYAVSGVAGFNPNVPKKHNKWIAPATGTICGITNGMTGMPSTPAVIYLNGIGLKKDDFVNTLGIYFLVSFSTLAICLGTQKIITKEIIYLAIFAVIPTITGQWIGKKIRTKLSEKMFRFIFYRVLIIVAIYLIIRTITG